MTSSITQQFKEAQKKYSGCLKQVSQNEFSANFDKVNSFQIILPSDYPSSPPHINRGKLDFPTPMTRNWNPNFTLSNLIEHLKVSSSISPPLHLELNKDEISAIIENSKPDAYSSREGREKLLKSSKSPTTQKAYEQVKSLSDKMEKEQKKIKTISNELTNNSGQSSKSSSSQVESKEKAIKMYRSEARKIESEINNMKDDIEISKFQKSKKDLTDLYERMYLLEGTAQLLEDRTDL